MSVATGTELVRYQRLTLRVRPHSGGGGDVLSTVIAAWFDGKPEVKTFGKTLDDAVMNLLNARETRPAREES